ncbi:GNAT family N-acetyltransferase [Rhodobacteraceae bacterium CCMM004]|nr:GNAT family N-acetyltransferase [Rhodobacteraceae bacterium CCMM004]
MALDDTLLDRGRYVAIRAAGAEDMARARALRALVFAADRGPPDAFDAVCTHVLIEDRATGEAVCTFRVLPLRAGAEIGRSYSAQFYGLEALQDFAGPMVELGRFCIRPGLRDGDILRVAWGALARVVDDEGAEMLFGCSSFRGTDAAGYADAFAVLGARHIAPRRWRPRVKARDVLRYAGLFRRVPDMRRALAAMPPLLRTYLAMGGWVSDHAVIDREMDTLHVFTGLEIAAIPPARARALRAVAG